MVERSKEPNSRPGLRTQATARNERADFQYWCITVFDAIKEGDAGTLADCFRNAPAFLRIPEDRLASIASDPKLIGAVDTGRLVAAVSLVFKSLESAIPEGSMIRIKDDRWDDLVYELIDYASKASRNPLAKEEAEALELLALVGFKTEDALLVVRTNA